MKKFSFNCVGSVDNCRGTDELIGILAVWRIYLKESTPDLFEISSLFVLWQNRNR